MPQKAHDNIMFAEHIMEVRHDASGSFLDVHLSGNGRTAKGHRMIGGGQHREHRGDG